MTKPAYLLKQSPCVPTFTQGDFLADFFPAINAKITRNYSGKLPSRSAARYTRSLEYG